MIRAHKVVQLGNSSITNDDGDETTPLCLKEVYSGEPVHEYTFENDKKPVRRKVREHIHNVRALFAEVFLPQGFPQTVSADYLDYQRWDTLQAFASSQNGALATLAVLKGVGVGNEHATVLAAALTWLLKDGVGMIARIIFAWARGSRLDSDNKRWRLFADLLNDASFLLDLLTPNLPRIYFTPLACFTAFLRSIVDVAGRTTRMSMIRHQARRDNLADVAAKDGSQETLVNVFSLFCSMTLLPIVDGNHVLIWLFFTLFTFIHLFANYNAVKSLQLETLNQARFHLATRFFLIHGTAPSIQWCNKEEPILHSIKASFKQRHLGCQLSVLPANMDLTELFVEEEGEIDTIAWKLMGSATSVSKKIICLVDRHNRIAWMFVAERTSDAELFDAFFAIEHYDLEEGWPDDSTTNAFREEMAAKKWSLQTNQLNIDEWRFNLQATEKKKS